jgi:hypothetical protein
MFTITTLLTSLAAIDFQCGPVKTAYASTCCPSAGGNENTTVAIPSGVGIRDASPVRLVGEWSTRPGVIDEHNAPRSDFLAFTLGNMAFGRGSDWVTSWMASTPRYLHSAANSQLEPMNSTSFTWEITFKDVTSYRFFLDFWSWPLDAGMTTPVEDVFDTSWTSNSSNPAHYTAFRLFVQMYGTFYRLSTYVSPEDESAVIAYWNTITISKFDDVIKQYGGGPYEFRVSVDYTRGFIKNVYGDSP